SQSVRHYLTGLLPGNYDVRKNGVSIATVPVDGQGVLYFEHSGGGTFELSGGVTGISGDEPVAEGFRLEQNYPNPFNPETVINYQLSVVSDVVLAVYNLLGEKVATLVNARQGAGQYQVQWNGRDQLGRQVSSGVYLYRLEAGGLVQSRKMILMR
ncbi:MAG: T9SS type A sorting domain-containing protein, partial [Calditrichaeota bacterium]|nr:T9SS type A sorting domain-containing protein [Calditrichota bacterium]MCB0315972.1 T9SS type A sorting domain-containing protein [Calditrichota bacterium]